MSPLPLPVVGGDTGVWGQILNDFLNNRFTGLDKAAGISAWDYGVLGTGGTYTTQLQNAINAAAALVGAGGVGNVPYVVLPPGIVGIGATIDPKGVLLLGHGEITGTVLRWDGATGGNMFAGTNNSVGGWMGFTFTDGANKPDSFIVFNTNGVDETLHMEHLHFVRCRADAIKVNAGWVNLHWSWLRWDNCGGYGIRATLGSGTFLASFNVENFTYDHGLTLSPLGTGVLCIDNTANNTAVGPVRLAHGRVEINQPWGGNASLITVIEPTTPAGGEAIAFDLDGVTEQHIPVATNYVIYRQTSDTTQSERAVVTNCVWSGLTNFWGGTLSTAQAQPDISYSPAFIAMSLIAQEWFGTVKGLSSVPGATALDFRRKNVGGIKVGSDTSRPLEVVSGAGTTWWYVDGNGTLHVSNTGIAQPFDLSNNTAAVSTGRIYNASSGGAEIGAPGGEILRVIAADGTTVKAAFDQTGGLRVGAAGTPTVRGCTGVPSNAIGVDGDVMVRSDGGALTTIYQRRAGAYVGIV